MTETPSYVWDWIREYIPIDKTIWEAFYGNGETCKYLSDMGFNIIHEPIDFYEHDIGDMIISNILYSDKKRIFNRLKTLNKPFIIICPSSIINTQYMRELFKDDGLQIMIPPKRINFDKLVNGEITANTSNCNFDCFIYCWKMNLPNDIVWL
jgi:hypothetical protein